MRTARLLTSAVLASAVVLGPAGSLAYADYEPAASLELWPTSASPGTTVTANTTACGPAGRATGDANTVGAGDFQMSGSPHKEVLAGQFQVASHAKPGSFRIRVSCENGKVVDGLLTVTAAGDRDRDQKGRDKSWGAGDPQGGRDKASDGGDRRGQDKSWDSNDPRGNDPRGNDQSGRDKTGNTADSHDPRGHVKTGVGGSIGPDTTEIAAGAAVLAAAAVGSTWLLRRRASGAQGRG
ncbi:hypothetical protein [Streptomyces violascens]|uniref:Secreted protein n=1 Tax=Streptomyces violascens TaxID=67381 RepID=A0ABQ3QKV7_9ACTN|nr:hypothetical protein [Streptomyces violascens]GGU45634.1 hypothetical protein GCM10010289_77690 [Streptomyces violascens]GHI37905.1 hypothetical protein Sviol_23130 [Streptomyces violascens]